MCVCECVCIWWEIYSAFYAVLLNICVCVCDGCHCGAVGKTWAHDRKVVIPNV